MPAAVMLDGGLPEMSGWTLLDRLMHDPRSSFIPVRFITGHENNRRGFALGAMSCMQKAMTRDELKEAFALIERSMSHPRQALLVIAENEVRAADIRDLLSGDDLEIVEVQTLAEASYAMESRQA